MWTAADDARCRVKIELSCVNDMLRRQRLGPIKPEPLDPNKKQKIPKL